MGRVSTLALLLTVASQQPAAAASVTASESERTISLRAGDGVLLADLDGGRLTGPQVELTRDHQRVFGKLHERRADVTWQRGRVTGFLGTRRVRVEVLQHRAGFQAVGEFGGEPIELRVSPSRILGEVAGCEYALTAAAEQYRGWRDCGGTPVPVATTLRFPEALKHAPDAEAAALLILFLHPQPLPGGPPDPRGETIRNPNL
jgi:hypothetical protein